MDLFCRKTGSRGRMAAVSVFVAAAFAAACTAGGDTQQTEKKAQKPFQPSDRYVMTRSLETPALNRQPFFNTGLYPAADLPPLVYRSYNEDAFSRGRAVERCFLAERFRRAEQFSYHFGERSRIGLDVAVERPGENDNERVRFSEALLRFGFRLQAGPPAHDPCFPMQPDGGHPYRR